MPSKHRYRSSSDDESSTSDSYSSSASSSDYHSRHRKRKKKRKSKQSKKKDKDRKRDKKRKKHSKSKRDKKSKSRRKDHKHRHSKKRHRTSDSVSNTNTHEPKQKKRKLHHTKRTKDPCASLSEQEMINNAKTVLTMFCENDTIKQYMRSIFHRLDHNQSISISNENVSYQQPLKMIFTFLSLTTHDDITYTKSTNHRILSDLFKNELNLTSNPSFIGPASAPVNYKQNKSTEATQVPSSDIVGVTMPTKEDLLHNTYSSEEEEDAFGPAVMDTTENNNTDQKRLLQMEHSKIYAEMNRKIRGNDADRDEDNEKREEWMTAMPTSSFLSDYEKGTRNRVFNTNEQKIDNTWTQTPSDLKRRKVEMKRMKKIEKQTNEKLKLFGLPSVEEQAMLANKKNDKDTEEMDSARVRDRRKSLFEEHQEKLMKEYKEELKEWKKRKKNGEKVGKKPVFKGVKTKDANASYTGSMDTYYNAQNPTFTRSKLNTFVRGGTIDDY